ncbi:MMPL family transporter [Microbacterium sp. NPDC056044]|uniref:MMPL family transporter n=1 Tax=Microbacterium sp. NPDC056044 TaxID=3345690 RepID=UPI0035D5836C
MARLLARLGRFSARHRWAVIIAWLGVLVTLAVVSLSGMRFSDGGFDVPGTSSSEAMSVLDEEFPSDDDESRGPGLQFVVEANDGSIVDPDNLAALTDALDEVRAVDGVTSVSDPLDPARPYISEDLTTAVASIEVERGVDPEEFPHEIEAIADDLSDAGFTAEVGGTLTSGAPEILGPSEIVGALLAFLVLLITYGSLVAAGANMLGALVGVGVGILGVLAFSAITPIGSLTPILAVMLGLAVGIDYCLFIIARFRSELREGATVLDAIGRAVGTAGSAVVFAGATVIIALTGLTVVGITFLGEMGLAAAFAVAVAVLMALTLVPAMLSLMGTKALSRRDRRRLDEVVVGEITETDAAPSAEKGFLAGWVRVVTRHRVLSLLGGAALLALMAVPVASMQTSLNTPGGEDPQSTQRAAYELVADKFGDGAQDPLVVLVREDDVEAALPTVLERLGDLDDVAMVIPAGISADGDTAMVTVMSEHGPLDDRTTELVKNIRAESGEIPGAELLVTGGTAIGLDSDEQLQSALMLYTALIVGLSLILMIVLFRSLLIPVVATLGFLLSLGAGLGATVAVFQWGWMDFIVPSPQGNPLLSLLPIVVTGILFGLAMDYQVFLVSRMHEAHARGLSPLEAIRAGFRHSAGVVVAAAAIMAAVFGGFAMSPSSLVGSIALALTVGVVADAFIVRMVLVPAALALLGRSAWWMPKWLDRILPTIDVEGAALESSTPAPALDPQPVRAREAVGADR